jgi:hypothetical protein
MSIAADYANTPAQAAAVYMRTPISTAATSIAPAASAFAAPDADADATVGAVAAVGAVESTQTSVGSDPGKGYVRLPGHVLDALAKATLVDAGTKRDQSMSLTLILKRDDQEGFDRYLHDVYDPRSPTFQQFLTQAQIADRFGPSKHGYSRVLAYLRTRGFRLVHKSQNRLTLTVRGSRADVERAFSVDIADFKVGDQAFYANRSDPAVPAAIAARLQALIGLNNLARPQSVIKPVLNNLKKCSLNTKYTKDLQVACAVTYGLDLALYDIVCMLSNLFLARSFPILNSAGGVVATTFGSVPTPSGPLSLCNFELPYQPTSLTGSEVRGMAHVDNRVAQSTRTGQAATPPAGQGQKIGLVEFDSFNTSDASDLLAYLGLPASQISRLNDVKLSGSPAVGPSEDEVLLDIGITLTTAPNATTTVYEAPFTGTGSFQSVFNRMIDDGMTVISNSWAYCEDQTTLADVQSIDAVLQNAAASGISVFSGSGDTGNTCLDGTQGAIAVPADSPHVTAVGGTTLNPGPGYYGSETWWDGNASVPATGQGGFGTSKFFARPAYQDGFVTSSQRSIPDVVSAADPAVNGLPICQADHGGCPNGLSYGGTSASTPFWASMMALFNAAGGKNIGLVNPTFYKLAKNASFNGFHTAVSMGSDFSHVGLGSPNGSFLYMALTGVGIGPGDAAFSGVGAVPAAVPADGVSAANFVVQLRDSNSATVAGKTISLSAGGGSQAVITTRTGTTSGDAGVATFAVTDVVPETVTFTATDTSDGVVLAQTVTITFGVPPAASAGITANPSTVTADGQSAATITVTLKDVLNRPTPGKTITVSNNGSHAVVSGPTPGVTDANGQITFSATDQVNESVTFTALDVTDDNLPVPGSGTVTYNSGGSTACNVGVAPVASAGYTITRFITGFPAVETFYYGGVNFGCPGADNPTFTSGGKVLVSDFLNGAIYQTSLSGGAVSSSDQISNLGPALGGLVYGKDGSLYATSGAGGGVILQVDPTTGAQLRVVVSGLTCPAGLAVDPLSGDLFFGNQCTGAGFDDPTIYRVIDPANSDPSKPTSKVAYATLPHTPNGGMAFAPNGTLYAVSGYYHNPTAAIEQISGTNSATVTVTPLAGVGSDYAIAIGVVNPDGSAQSLIVEPAGVLTEVPIADPSAATVIASVSPGIGVAGPDGCLYSVVYDTIYRLANSSGDCTFAPTSPAPSIKLTPAAVSPNPAQGSAQTLTATLHNVSSLSGVPVFFQIGGTNTQLKLVHTDANGNAVVSYTGMQAGTDTVIATTTAGGTPLQSNTARLIWAAGKHVTFISLNAGPGGGVINQPVTVVGQLSDASVDPATPLSGQTLNFTLAGSTCTATTDSSGNASCQVTPSQVGTGTLSAAFAGSSTLVAAAGSSAFLVLAAAAPAPTVTLSVSPTSVAAGGSATLTWSSTNATACTASGSWSGTEATSGTQSVTPADVGSYTYTLTCTGNGGSAAASAVLSANLVTVTVTAKSGGGSFGGYLCLCLGLLVMLRLYAVLTARKILLMNDEISKSRSLRAGGLLNSEITTTVLALTASVVVLTAGAGVSRAAGSSLDDPGSPLNHLYVGVRVGSMPVRLDSSKLDQGLATLGYGSVSASTDTSAVGGTAYMGYEFTPHLDAELGYTHRNANVARLSGAIASTASLTPLLQDTAQLIRGYGNLYSLSLRGRFELAPRFSLDPRLGGFFWDTKVMAVGDAISIDTTHRGGGVTVGLGASYRVWRGLALGIGVDHFRGFPNNIATLYGASLEWRFGQAASSD